MAEYSRMAKGFFTSGGTSGFVNLPFQPDYVELWNLTNIQAAPAQNKVTRAWWDNKLVNAGSPQANVTMLELYPSGSSTFVSFDTIVNSAASPGINSFSAGQLLQFGPTQQVVASTKGTTTSFQVTGHGYAIGDVVLFEGLFQSSTTGMPQMNGMPFTVATVTDANNFVVNWNSNNAAYTNLSASPSSAKVKKILYPYIYLPGTSVIEAITLGSSTTVVTTSAHNLRVGQEVAFRIPSQWGTVELNSLPNTLIPGSPVYGFVTSVSDFKTVVVNINSSSYTAFTTNVAVTAVPGLSFPQIVAVGDLNTGGEAISAGSLLYPPPIVEPIGTSQFGTINGPAIRGAFVNNTSQGFSIGAGVGVTNTSATIMTTSDIIYWHAYLHDFGG